MFPASRGERTTKDSQQATEDEQKQQVKQTGGSSFKSATIKLLGFAPLPLRKNRRKNMSKSAIHVDVMHGVVADA